MSDDQIITDERVIKAAMSATEVLKERFSFDQADALSVYRAVLGAIVEVMREADFRKPIEST